MKVLLLLLCALLPLHGVSLWSEGAPGQGDLSDDYLNPDVFTVGLGSNTISAEVNSTEVSPGVFIANEDFFTLVVPAGMQISGIFLLGYNFPVPGNKTFLGYQDGPTLLQAPETFTVSTSDRIADLLFGTSEVVSDPFSYPFDPGERNLLDDFGSGFFATNGPLPPGEYAFWLREIETDEARFTFDFYVTEFIPVPEPSPLWLLLAVPLILRARRDSPRSGA